MKNNFYVVAALIISCSFSWHVNAQITLPIIDPEIYVSPYGLSGSSDYGTGGFSNAISPSRLIETLTDNTPIYTGDVTIYFAEGDYYTDFAFYNLANSISHLEMYGGFDPNVSVIDLTDRDLITDETRFHATGYDIPLQIGKLPYYGNAFTLDVCIIDGITITSDNLQDSYYALYLVGINSFISQCKIENFSTTNRLIFIEGPDYTTTFVNCLFTDNEANNFIGLCSHANFINTTIAGNDFKEEMLIPYSGEYTCVMRNTIVYGNSNMEMDVSLYTTYSFNVRHSILETNESWIIDDGGNEFNTDPLFTNLTHTPYSCDYYSSPARMAGEPNFITSISNVDTAIIYFDVINMYRFGNYDQTSIDIGAHQNGNDYNPYFIISRPFEENVNQSNDTEIETIHLWTKSHTLFVENKQGEMMLMLYNTAGQIIYTGSLHDGINTIPVSLNVGTYIARTSSIDRNDNYTKLIIE